MSFADVAHKLPVAADVHSAPAVAELQRLLKPLAANNTALQHAAAQLSSDASPLPNAPLLRRVRALREQNRHIVRAASNLVVALDALLPNASAPLLRRAADAKARFQTLLHDFSRLVHHSAAAENAYLQRLQQQPAPHEPHALTESQTALVEEEKQLLFVTPTESQPLLPASQRTAAERATLRELHTTHSLAREQNTVLTEMQSSIHDVNSIFKDLAVMVADQRPQLEYVEVALSDSTRDVQRARNELEKTKRRHERNKRFFFVSLLSVAAVVAVLLILVFN
ncbi:hypothetical protein BWQ96_04068 [Gracilariopsis chorda]|uniref:t-SNARE coiled-coil homology domain-containing protein n=1 Tax=Gracilariopsis chorda TaxID=448386 RepID=A0A2V3IVP9_9FLOR|nr:hypothetical protein BWQ96_04068 [Gracilariopsis chorda]|eukprot:PXF46191.1 hypothetical protein BWQ96_04068 [Gracilariopsis chorda]